MLITVIIPCYNEKNTILRVIEKINRLRLNIQIIVVDDFSTDGSRELLKKNKKINKLIFNKKNLGKGGAIQKAKKYVKGKIVIIQDADLEYSPNDYKKLIIPIKRKFSNVVYGSRVLNKKRYYKNKFTSNFRVFGNHILTIISNLINNQNLTDAHTCYKVFNSKIFKKIKLNENGFGFCSEITTKCSLMNEKILEVPISYKGRGYKQGKKIRIIDAFISLAALVKYRYFFKY